MISISPSRSSPSHLGNRTLLLTATTCPNESPPLSFGPFLATNHKPGKQASNLSRFQIRIWEGAWALGPSDASVELCELWVLRSTVNLKITDATLVSVDGDNLNERIFIDRNSPKDTAS